MCHNTTMVAWNINNIWMYKIALIGTNCEITDTVIPILKKLGY